MLPMAAIVFDGARETIFQRHRGCPAGGEMKLHPGGVDATDIDGFLVVGEWNDLVRTRSGCLQQQFDEVLQRDGLRSSKIEVIARYLPIRGRNQQCVNDIFNMVE